MKRYFVLNGSPRGRGSATMKLVAAFLEGVRSVEKIDVQQVDLYAAKIGTCKGCYTCWRTTPGRCVQRDDMDALLERYATADVVVWATPIYHFGMTALMKRFLERTLPEVYPYQVLQLEDGLYHHPSRYGRSSDRKHLLFSTCGFPDADNFRPLKEYFEKLLGSEPAVCLFVPEGELLKVPALENRTSVLFAEAKAAGAEWAVSGLVDPARLEMLATPIIPRAQFAELASSVWNAPGETPPTPAQVRGEEPFDPLAPGRSEAVREVSSHSQGSAGYQLLRQMAAAFNAAKAHGMHAVVEFVFTDVDEYDFMTVQEDRCDVSADCAPKPTTRIITTLATWKAICEGRLKGQQAFMDGLCRVEGDFAFLMKMAAGLFGGRAAQEQSSESEGPAVQKKRNLLFVAFIPWSFGWFLAGLGPLVGIAAPLGIGTAFLLLRERQGEATLFERGTAVAFALLAGLYVIAPAFATRFQSTLCNVLIMVLWGGSVLVGRPVTAEYSRLNYGEAIWRSKLFTRINAMVTGFWTAMYGIQATLGFTLHTISHWQYALIMVGIAVFGMGFTMKFPKWYSARMMRGGLPITGGPAPLSSTHAS